MSQEYRYQTNVKKESQISALLSDAPFALKEFAVSIRSGARETSTRLAYYRDILEFLKYEMSVLPELKDTELADFPTEVLDALTVSDLEEYRNYLHDVRLSGNSAIKRKLSALSVFFRFRLRPGLHLQESHDGFRCAADEPAPDHPAGFRGMQCAAGGDPAE